MRGHAKHVPKQFVLRHGARQRSDMDEVALIDFSFEDDSLLPSITTAENKRLQTFGSVLRLSPAFVSEPDEKAQEYNSKLGGMERATGFNAEHILKPTVQSAVLQNDSEAAAFGEDNGFRHGELQVDLPIPGILESTSAQGKVENLPQHPERQRRSARASNHLRKSLAWDKAFSTDEGVLDVDELPLVAKTPRKRPDLQPLKIPDILVTMTPATLPNNGKTLPRTAAIVREERIGSTASEIIHSESLSSELATTPNHHEALPLTVTAPAKTPKRDAKSRLAPENQIIKADVLKGTKLRLPSSFTGKREKIVPSSKPVTDAQYDSLRRCKSSSSVLSPSSAGSALSKKVSSVSKKVKDTLGRVLPGGFGGSTKSPKLNKDDASDSPHDSAPRTSQAPSDHSLDIIGEDLGSPAAASAPKSKSKKGFFSGTSSSAKSGKKTSQQAETSSRDLVPADPSTGSLVPSLKGSPGLKNVGLLMSLMGKNGPSAKQSTEKSSFYSSKISPVQNKTKSFPATSLTPSIGTPNPQTAVRNDKISSSSLRHPSPKIGFFDPTRPSAGAQDGSSSDKVATENSSVRIFRKGLPPKPQQGPPPARVGQLHTDDSAFPAGNRPPRSALPPASHLKPSGKREISPVLPNSGTTTSPRKLPRGLLSPPPRQAVSVSRLSSKSNSVQSHNRTAEATSHKVRNESARTFRKLPFDSRGGGQPPRSFDNEDGAGRTPSTSEGAGVTSGSLNGSTIITNLVNSAADASNRPLEQSPSQCRQLSETTGKTVNDGKLSTMVENLSPGSQVLFGKGIIDSVLCREEAASVIDAVITSNIESSVCNLLILPLGKLEPGERREAAPPAGSSWAHRQELETAAAIDRLDLRARGEFLVAQANNELETSVGQQPRPHMSPRENDPPNKLGSGSSIQVDCAANGPKDSHADEPVTSEIGEAKSTSGSIRTRREEWIQDVTACSCTRHLESDDVKRKITSLVDVPPRRAGLPSPGTAGPREQNSSIPPASSKRHPSTVIHLENSSAEQEIERGIAKGASHVNASDGRLGKTPLSPNAGLLNSISGKTMPTASRKDSNLQLASDHAPSDEVFGQENSKVSEGRVGITNSLKPRQKKLPSYQQVHSEEWNGSADLPFPFSEERLRSLEAAGQESLQKKSGAVQHSPPQKSKTNQNPWSPVKRNGQQLGPFDCTKKHANTITG